MNCGNEYICPMLVSKWSQIYVSFYFCVYGLGHRLFFVFLGVENCLQVMAVELFGCKFNKRTSGWLATPKCYLGIIKFCRLAYTSLGFPFFDSTVI
jgi:hypothetical protein